MHARCKEHEIHVYLRSLFDAKADDFLIKGCPRLYPLTIHDAAKVNKTTPMKTFQENRSETRG